MDRRFSKKVDYILLLLLLLLFMLFFASATSPLFDNLYGYDSAFFRFIGSSILKGKTPYIDIWDNKGPILFFIQAIGALRGTQNGKISLIFPMQVISLFVSVLFLKRTDDQLNPSGRWKMIRFFLLTICSLTIFGVTIQGGNLTEEWSLPMICCSLYFFTKYMAGDGSELTHTRTFSHPRSYAFIHGICFALIALIRVNNAVTICAGIIVIGIHLMIHRQWKNIIENIIFGLLGISVVAVPVCLWFASRHALEEMLFAVFTFNLKYAGSHSHTNYIGHDFLVRYLPLMICLSLILIHLIRSRIIRLIDVLSLVIVFLNLLLLGFNNVYLHYFTIVFPVFLFISIIYVNQTGIIEVLITAAFFIFMLPDCRMVLYWNFTDNTYPIFPTANMYVPKAERDSMIGIDVTPEIYLIKGMTPCSRFAAYQPLHFSVEPDFKEEFVKDLQTKQPKWIVTRCGSKSPYPDIQNIIDTQYSQNFMDTTYCFYRRNE